MFHKFALLAGAWVTSFTPTVFSSAKAHAASAEK
jgi:hypothetical protein